MLDPLYQNFYRLLKEFSLAQMKDLYGRIGNAGNVPDNISRADWLAKLWDKVRIADFKTFTAFEKEMKNDFSNLFPAQDFASLKQALAAQNNWPQSYKADESRYYLHLNRQAIKDNFYDLLSTHKNTELPYVFLLKGEVEHEPNLAVETAMDYYKYLTKVQPKRLPETNRPMEKFNFETQNAEEAWRNGMNFLLDISWDEEPEKLEAYNKLLNEKQGKEVIYAYLLVENWQTEIFQEYLTYWAYIQRAVKKRFFIFLKFLNVTQELWNNEIPKALKEIKYPVIKQFPELEKITKEHFDKFFQDPNIKAYYIYKPELFKSLPPLYMQDALEKLEYKGTL